MDVPRTFEGRDLRNSYVTWQEEVNPVVIVELLSPGTAQQDLGGYAEEDEEERLETIEPAYGSDLRWHDAQKQWIPNGVEQIEQQRLRAEQEQQRAEQAVTQLHQAAINLLRSSMSIEQVPQITALSEAQIRQLAP